MLSTTLVYIVLAIAAFPSIYYLIALFSSWRFFRRKSPASAGFAPPVSILKPIRGLDPDAYENFASFCRLDYPEYEIVFCAGEDEPAVALIERLKREYPERPIRILFGSGRTGAVNDKVAKLARLTGEARYEHLVISDSDVRVQPDYLHKLVAPLANPQTGAATCFYLSTGEKSFADRLQTVGMISDFYAGLLVARQLDGVKFALGTTIATTRTHLASFGGYGSIENKPADDLLVGRLIAEQGYEVELLPYTIEAVSDYESMRELLYKRMRWLVVMRHMRPWGHLGLIFAQGLAWSILAAVLAPGAAAGYLGAYVVLRLAMMWAIGVHGLKCRALWRKMPLVVVWDALATILWLVSFLRSSIRWRGGDYYIRDGLLVPASGD
ncbi:MAG TPA: glycosyltransferase [Bryobacteraceae bacterium]